MLWERFGGGGLHEFDYDPEPMVAVTLVSMFVLIISAILILF